jgi:hypothetical protein
MKEEIELQAAFMAIKRERRESLREMFTGTQLNPKSRVEDAKNLATDGKACVAAMKKIPGVTVPKIDVPSVNLPSIDLPSIDVPAINLNINIFKGIDLRALVNFRIPTLSLPGVDLSWIPDIKLGKLPHFDLERIRINLKGILKFKDLLPDISLRALAFSLAVKWPSISFPSLIFDLSKILNIPFIDFDLVFPRFRLAYPDFFSIDLHIRLPDISVPDINLPSIAIPHIDLPEIDLSSLRIPDFDISGLIKIPGFDKVLRLLFSLFDLVDLPAIIIELGLAFIMDFVSAVLPIVQQVKAGAQAASNWAVAAQDWHKANKTKAHSKFLLPGNARDACEAVATLLRNSRDEHATLAGIQTTQLGASTAGLFVDLGGVTGPAVAAAAAVAKTCQKVLIMGARYKEVKKVNLILRSEPDRALASNIFQVSPLLGAYYLANNTTSNVLNILSNNLLEDDWMAHWEVNKREHLDPLIAESKRFILESRYVLAPIRQSKGMYQQLGFTERLQAGATLYIKKKLGRVPAGTRAPTHKFIG